MTSFMAATFCACFKKRSTILIKNTQRQCWSFINFARSLYVRQSVSGAVVNFCTSKLDRETCFFMTASAAFWSSVGGWPSAIAAWCTIASLFPESKAIASSTAWSTLCYSLLFFPLVDTKIGFTEIRSMTSMARCADNWTAARAVDVYAYAMCNGGSTSGAILSLRKHCCITWRKLLKSLVWNSFVIYTKKSLLYSFKLFWIILREI